MIWSGVLVHLNGRAESFQSLIHSCSALVPAASAPPFARRPAQALWLGPGHHLVHYPVSAGEFVNLVAFAPAGDYTTESWTATATVEELLAEFAGWDERLLALLCAAGTPGRWALLDRALLTRWTSSPVTLLGDAAHPMFPFFGQGAAQAIEDAATLGRCLAAGRADPPVALRRYEGLCIPAPPACKRSATPARTSTTCPTAPSRRPATPRSPVPTRWRPAAGLRP
jgi:salicylate hydroxylase